MSARRAGMTLVELLIAGSLLSVILVALSWLFVGTSRAYGVNATLTAGSGQVQGAIQALGYDASLAGYCGVAVDCDALVDAFDIALDPNDGPCHDVVELELRYVEDRFTAGGPVAQLVRYTLDPGGQLERGVDGGDAVAIAEGIEAFEFCGYRARSDADGALRFSRPAAGDLLGVEFRLAYRRTATASATERFAVTLPNVP